MNNDLFSKSISQKQNLRRSKIIKSERIHLISISEKYNELLENKVISINAYKTSAIYVKSLCISVEEILQNAYECWNAHLCLSELVL